MKRGLIILSIVIAVFAIAYVSFTITGKAVVPTKGDATCNVAGAQSEPDWSFKMEEVFSSLHHPKGFSLKEAANNWMKGVKPDKQCSSSYTSALGEIYSACNRVRINCETKAKEVQACSYTENLYKGLNPCEDISVENNCKFVSFGELPENYQKPFKDWRENEEKRGKELDLEGASYLHCVIDLAIDLGGCSCSGTQKKRSPKDPNPGFGTNEEKKQEGEEGAGGDGDDEKKKVQGDSVDSEGELLIAEEEFEGDSLIVEEQNNFILRDFLNRLLG